MSDKHIPQKTRLEGLVEWLQNFGAPVGAVIGSFVVGFYGVWLTVEDEGWQWFISWPFGIGFSLAAALSLIAGIITATQSPGIRNLEKDVVSLSAELRDARQNYSDHFDSKLALIAQSLGLGPHERITVYRHDGMAFMRLARYSENPEFRKPGRLVYPDNQGCIGYAWADGKAFDNTLPDYNKGAKEYYQAVSSKQKIPQEVAKKFRMKSRILAGFAVFEPTHITKIAVVVFESTRENGLDQVQLDEAYKSFAPELAMFLRRWKNYEPSLLYAQEEGF